MDANIALERWLDLLLRSASRERLIFSEFWLRHDGRLWQSCATGEPWWDAEHVIEQKIALTKIVSVKQKASWWRARCLLMPQLSPRRAKTDPEITVP